MNLLLAALVAVAAAAGALLVVAAFLPAPAGPARPRRAPAWWSRLVHYYRGTGSTAWRRRLMAAAALLSGLIVWQWTGWLIALVLVPAAALGLPYLLRAPDEQNSIARLEAMEEWARSLSGVLDVGVGLEQAIITSTRSTPEPIAREVRTLAARLRAGVRTTDALLAFADELNDATGDYLAAALLLAAERRGTGLIPVLEGIAATVADHVKNRREIETERARPRTSVRWVTLIAVGALAALLGTGDYLSPYGTALGQLILAGLLTAYLGALVWMRKAAVTAPLPRFLSVSHGSGEKLVGASQ